VGNVGKYAFLGGVVIAAALAFVPISNGYLILAVLGLIVGVMNITDDETQGFLIAAIALMMTATSLRVLPEIGETISAISGNLAAFVAPAALVVAMKSLLDSSKD